MSNESTVSKCDCYGFCPRGCGCECHDEEVVLPSQKHSEKTLKHKGISAIPLLDKPYQEENQKLREEHRIMKQYIYGRTNTVKGAPFDPEAERIYNSLSL